VTPSTVSDWLIAPLLSERLRLRAWAEGDERAIVALKMDSEVRQYHEEPAFFTRPGLSDRPPASRPCKMVPCLLS